MKRLSGTALTQQKSRRLRQAYALIAVAALILCACGTRIAEKGKVQKPIPSAKKITTEQEKRDLLWEQQYNTSKQCIYDYSYEEGFGVVEGYTWEESSIIQRDRNGKMLSYHKIDDDDGYDVKLLWVSQKHLCYTISDFDDENHTVYAVPIEQKNGTEQVLWEQQETVAQASENTVYIAEPLLFYIKGKYLYSYDLENKKTERILKGEQQISMDFINNLAGDEGALYVADGKDSEDGSSFISNYYYHIDTKSGKAEKAYSVAEGYRSELLAASGNLLYLKQKNLQDGSASIECYDREKQKIKGSVQIIQLRQFLKDEKLIRPEEKLDTMDLSLHVSQDRVYFHLELSYDYGHKEKYTDVDGTVVVSAPKEQPADLSNETTLNEWLFEHTAENWIEESFTLCGDEIFLYYEDNKADGKSCMAGYHIENKTVRELKKSEPIYQQIIVLLSDIVWLGGSHWE